MDINCHDCQAWFNRGKILANLGRYEEAIASYDRALAIKISYYEAWCEKGVILEELGCYQEAEVCFNESLGIFGDECLEEHLAEDQLLSIPGKDNESIYYNKACFHALIGDLEQGMNNLRQAITLNPHKYVTMAECDRDLDFLRNNRQFNELVAHKGKLTVQST